MVATSQTNKRQYSAFGKHIVNQLVDKNMTAKQLAETLNITPQYLNKIIHGERSGRKYIKALENVFHPDNVDKG